MSELENKEKDASELAIENINSLAEAQKSMSEKMEEFLKQQAAMNTSLIRPNEEEKEVGKNYGYLQAKKEVALGKTALAPYWDDKTTKRYSEYLHMVAEKDYDSIKKAFGDNVQDGVSNWTPTEFISELVRLSFVSSVMLPKVTIVPMGRDKATLPKPSGELAWGFVDAGGAMVDDKFTAGTLSLDTHKAYGMALVNQEDLDDPAMPLAPYVASQLAEDNAKFIDKVILYGDADGSTSAWEGAFDGWAHAASVEAVAGGVDASPTFGELLTVANLQAMVGKLDEQELEGAEWFFSPAGWASIRGLQYQVSDGAAGTTDSGQPLIPLNAEWNYPLFGFQTNITSRVVNAGAASTAAAFFGNPKHIYFGDRMNMSIARSEHYRFANDQVVFRALQRFAVAVGLPSSLVKISWGAAA